MAGCCFKAYSIIDIFSRKLVGYRVEDREVDDLAVEMFQDAIAREGLPDVVHADSGPAMRSTVLKDYLGDLGVTQTHNRPRVSNDNPYSESEFRTMKYRPNYPGTFETIEQARAFMGWYVPWYNENHKHSGIALFSPNEVHDGTWRELWARRTRTQQAYYEKHPERFRARPTAPAPGRPRGHQPPRRPNHNPRPNDSRQLDTARVAQFVAQMSMARSSVRLGRQAGLGLPSVGLDRQRPFRVTWVQEPARLVVDVYTGTPLS